MTPEEHCKLNALVAEHVMGEPKPMEFRYDWEVDFSNYLNGTPTLSEGGNWHVATRYENGDNQEWVAQPFSEDMNWAWKVVEVFIPDNSQEGWHDYSHSPFAALHLANMKSEEACIAICEMALKERGAKYG